MYQHSAAKVQRLDSEGLVTMCHALWLLWTGRPVHGTPVALPD